jgi:hypothetical protein
MPIARFQMPDGRVARFEMPDGTTPEQAQSMMASYISQQASQAPQAQSAPNPTEGNSFFDNLAAGVGKGVTDIALGAKQRLDEAAAYLENKFGGQSINAALGFKNAADIKKETQAAVDEKRQLDAPLMQTVGGKVGNFIGQAIPAVAAPGAGSLAGSVASGAALGAAQPTTEDESVLNNAALGAVGGAVGYGVGKAASRIVSPNAATNPEVQLLKDEGVTPTIGQTLGGAANKVEEKLQSLPIMGDAIAAARGRSLQEFNNAAINRATAPIGVEVKGVGQQAVKEAGDALSNAYNDVLSQIPHVTFDEQFANDVVQLNQMAKSLVPPMQKKFNDTLDQIVLDRMSPQGSMLGDTFKSVDSELGLLASKYSKSQVASESELGDAILQLQNLLKQQMVRSNPQIAEKINAIDEGWANLVRVEGAARAAKNNNGIFTPAQLNSAVQAADDSVRKRAVARGTALMQDLGTAGQDVLGSKVPDSGTAGRAALSLGALSAGYLNPGIPIGLGAGAIAYSKPVQNILNSILTVRPQAALRAGSLINRYAAIPAAAGSALAVMPKNGLTAEAARLKEAKKNQAMSDLGNATSVDAAIDAFQRTLGE